tara:strand:- start:366 stop:563 length:198 start_codon:yes stop_codon:yes gene_type:complete
MAHEISAVKYLILEQQIADLEKRIKEDTGELESLKYARSELSTNWLGMVGSNLVKKLKSRMAAGE